tara:strand:- start:391 stop:648 length:258 start_codon:yes stop_codon:yes gene_type:complete
MCIGGGSAVSYPDVGPRDTSNEEVVSKYELSDANKSKNASIRARNKAKSLVSFGGGQSNENPGGGSTSNNGLSSPTASSGNFYTA